MIAPENLAKLCYCRCCCLSDDPTDSTETVPFEGATFLYNRRTDCSCKWRWPYCVDHSDLRPEHIISMIAMRARDLGKPDAASEAYQLLARLHILIANLP